MRNMVENPGTSVLAAGLNFTVKKVKCNATNKKNPSTYKTILVFVKISLEDN